MTAEAAAVPAVRHVSVATALNVPNFVEREAPALLDYFGRRVPAEDAADLLGETLVVVWRRVSVIPNDETRARMWLYGVARKVLSGHRRSTKRQTALAEKLRLELSVQPVHEATEFDRVREQIAQLPEIDREIIGLVYWEGFSLTEVAGILGMRPATVRSRHARARATLRLALGT
ncbi:sigma-70 family RNA polymerase sigma factor [Glaciihabitans arcticus]|uniref:Sigma-70 family RNA polymerase sigma factor n=1 Tax=Glaciihabitans arcticus TaxID=2668039 RepID=A0A4Q9H022_9MICO|nr:sigma-70 family RNA polymerase sigma factor [Glaciihabitans arcticus]TBN58020.1 sigma-70 family RNA polymerase sigma factor [Glaciihabitans arcticus]